MNGLIEAGMRQVLQEEGFAGCELHFWDLSYCQGAGATFRGTPDEPAALIARFAPESVRNDISLLFSETLDTPAELTVTAEHYGPGLPYTQISLQDGTAFDEQDDDTGHEALARSVLKDEMLGIEKRLQEHVRDTCKRMADEGYKINEACDPFWWAGELERVEEHNSCYSVLRRFEIGDYKAEIRLYPLSNYMEDDYESSDLRAEKLQRLRSGESVIGEVTCRIEDLDGNEATSTCITGEIDKDWTKDSHFRQICRETMSEAIGQFRDDYL